MASEIERTFHVRACPPNLGPAIRIEQIYLPDHDGLLREPLTGHLWAGGAARLHPFDTPLPLPVIPADDARTIARLDKRTVRVRRACREGEAPTAVITIKGPGYLARPEFEYEVDPRLFDTATRFSNRCIRKTRHIVSAGDRLAWEIDYFDPPLHGLVLADIELPHEQADFPRPHWLGEEVTDDPRYRNSVLAREIEIGAAAA